MADRQRAREPLARLVLEAAYEATLLAGGAFGNEAPWIDAAIERALRCVAGQQLDVVVVSR